MSWALSQCSGFSPDYAQGLNSGQPCAGQVPYLLCSRCAGSFFRSAAAFCEILCFPSFNSLPYPYPFPPTSLLTLSPGLLVLRVEIQPDGYCVLDVGSFWVLGDCLSHHVASEQVAACMCAGRCSWACHPALFPSISESSTCPGPLGQHVLSPRALSWHWRWAQGQCCPSGACSRLTAWRGLWNRSRDTEAGAIVSLQEPGPEGTQVPHGAAVTAGTQGKTQGPAHHASSSLLVLSEVR